MFIKVTGAWEALFKEYLLESDTPCSVYAESVEDKKWKERER
jgi:hypothetical protein